MSQRAQERLSAPPWPLTSEAQFREHHMWVLVPSKQRQTRKANEIILLFAWAWGEGTVSHDCGTGIETLHWAGGSEPQPGPERFQREESGAGVLSLEPGRSCPRLGSLVLNIFLS